MQFLLKNVLPFNVPTSKDLMSRQQLSLDFISESSSSNPFNNIHSFKSEGIFENNISPIEEDTTDTTNYRNLISTVDEDTLESEFRNLILPISEDTPETNYINLSNSVRQDNSETNYTNLTSEDTPETKYRNFTSSDNDKTPENNFRSLISPVSEDTSETNYRNLRRSSSLKSGKTPPGTPSSKKIVRFADVLGLDLSEYRTYLDEIPKIPKSAYEDLCYPDSDEENDLDSQQGYDDSASFAVDTPKSLTIVALFNQPGYESNFFQLLKSNKVCLEKISISKYFDGNPILSGTIRVTNIHFNKIVYVRYTVNKWASYEEILAKYITNSCDGYSDKFNFVLYTHTWRLTPLQTIEMCIKYITNGQTYWDNNFGRNYVFQCQYG